jgi:acyl-homoserine-lactone acylase
MCRFFFSLWILILSVSSSALWAQVAPSTGKIDPQRITIHRDKWGVPHIFAPTDAEAAYGLGWAHCEDDFEDIQNSALMVRGMSGLNNGIDGAKLDFFRYYVQADLYTQEQYERDLSADYRAYVEAYAQAISDYAAKFPKKVKMKGIFPVSGLDISRGYIMVMAAFSQGDRALGAVLGGYTDKYYYNSGKYGSNAMAYRSNKTTDGKTHLVLNPHVPLSGNFTFWEANVYSDQGMEMHGGVFPGTPLFGMGVNQNLGWAMTFNWAKYTDIFKLRLNPENKYQYWYDGAWQPIESRKMPLRVNLGGLKITVKRELLYTALGPAIRDKKGDTYVTRIPNNLPTRAGEEWFRMGKSANLDQFRTALKMQNIPIFNVMYADKADNIYWQYNASIPKRNTAYDWTKAVRGDTSNAIWTECYTLDELPHLINPPSGYLYSSNNSPFHTSAPADCLPRERYDNGTQMWEWNHENNRDLRFRELIASVDKIDTATMRRIKYDPHYPQTTPTAGSRKTFNAFQTIDENKYPSLKQAIRYIKAWELRGDTADTLAALVLNTFYPLFHELDFGLSQVEMGFSAPEALVIKYLRKAKARLMKHYGTLTPPLSKVQVIRRGKYEIGVNGLPECLSAMYGEIQKDGKILIGLGETYIGFARFGPNGLESYETIVPYGTSDDPKSPHYADQMRLFAEQKTKPMPITREAARAAAVRIYHPGE